MLEQQPPLIHHQGSVPIQPNFNNLQNNHNSINNNFHRNHNHHHHHHHSHRPPNTKAFTIDAILGTSNHSAIDYSTNTNAVDRRRDTSPNGRRSQGKCKRVRTIFTAEQLERLEAEFERQQYMVGPERLYLAHALRLTEAQVKVWFQNRRIKWRKQHLEVQQARLAAFQDRRDSSDECNDVTQSSTGIQEIFTAKD